MKLFKSTILAMLGMAVAFTACSDDDKYTQGAQSPGAYFSADDTPSMVNLAQDGSSFDVTVYRTSTDAPATYQVTATDPSGLFTVPTSVTFDANALTATLTVTYDNNDIVTDKVYPLSLTLSGASEYGAATYEFTVCRKTPLVTKPFLTGKGSYSYTQYWDWTCSDITVERTFNPNDSTNLTINMSAADDNEDFIGNFPVQIPNYDYDKTEGTVKCYMEPIFLGNHSSYGPVYVADIYTYYKYVLGWDANAAEVENATYFDYARGCFYLDVIYYVPEYGEGTSYFGEGYEYLQLDGYPQLGISVEYLGTMIMPSGSSYEANVQVTPGVDVKYTNLVMVPGDDEELAYQAVLGNTNCQITQVKGNAESRVGLPLEEGGVYTIGALTYGEGDVEGEFASASFQVFFGDSPYVKIGDGVFADGWFIPGFTMGGAPIDNLEYAWEVPMLQSKEDKTLVYLNSPYTREFILSSQNGNTEEYNIGIYTEDPTCVYIPEQLSGFSLKGDLRAIGDWAGLLVANNPDASLTAIKNYIIKNDGTPSTLEDGLIEVVECLFSQNGEFGYQWRNPQNSYILLPDASDAKRRAFKARQVARPAQSGALRQVANSTQKVQKQRIHSLKTATRK